MGDQAVGDERPVDLPQDHLPDVLGALAEGHEQPVSGSQARTLASTSPVVAIGGIVPPCRDWVEETGWFNPDACSESAFHE